VTGFLEGFPAERRASLQAYGLSRDDWVTVLQNSPVTVVQLDNTELALENELAERIQVSQILKEEQDENRQ
jgi:Fe2+ transport system protein FeoA